MSDKVVATDVLTAHILDKFQSGYPQEHSTETTLLRVSNDIMMSSVLCGVDCSVVVQLLILA